MAFIAPEMSLLAERVRSVGVASGASRLRSSSDLFVEFDFFIRRSLVEQRESNERALTQFHALGSALSRLIYVTFLVAPANRPDFEAEIAIPIRPAFFVVPLVLDH